eukprot:365992-Chlamydomonas_euryale.AAC.7
MGCGNEAGVRCCGCGGHGAWAGGCWAPLFRERCRRSFASAKRIRLGVDRGMCEPWWDVYPPSSRCLQCDGCASCAFDRPAMSSNLEGSGDTPRAIAHSQNVAQIN